MNFNAAVRAVVIVDRRAMAGTPAQHQHLDKLAAANAMTPVVAVFEADVRLQLFGGDIRSLQPIVNLFE